MTISPAAACFLAAFAANWIAWTAIWHLWARTWRAPPLPLIGLMTISAAAAGLVTMAGWWLDQALIANLFTWAVSFVVGRYVGAAIFDRWYR